MRDLELTGSSPTPLEYEILSMQRGDLPQIIEIERDSFSEPWPTRSFEDCVGDPSAYAVVARTEKRVLGYLISWEMHSRFWIANLAVRSESRRRGVARRLLFRALEEARERGHRAVYLDVRPTNQTAIQLYSGLGFRMVGRRPAYYSSPPEDAWVMRKKL